MQDAWPNPFAAKREEARWQSGLEELSDEDENCTDQVVYHDDHLENLFGLYNRVDEAKVEGHLQQNASKTGLDKTAAEEVRFKDHLSLAIPSDRETAVWGALEASETSFQQEALQGPEKDTEQLWSYDSLVAHVRHDKSLSLGDGLMNFMVDENNAAEECQQRETCPAEVVADVSRTELQAPDGWDDVIADVDVIYDQVVGLSSIKYKNHSLVKPKGSAKKRQSLNFRSMHNVNRVQDNLEERNHNEKLTLAEKLQSLVETPSLKKDVQARLKRRDPSTRVPMSMKLLELAQNDAQHSGSKKTKEKLDAPGETSSKLCIKEELGVRATKLPVKVTPSESISDQFRKALLQAPPVSTEVANRQSKVHVASSGFAARLQKVLERERGDRADFLRMLQTRHKSFEGHIGCMDVKIVSKSLEARLSSCECHILKLPEMAYVGDTVGDMKVMVIFNMQANSQMELESGTIVRLYSPWQEVIVQNGHETLKTLLCTYFCEVLSSTETK